MRLRTLLLVVAVIAIQPAAHAGEAPWPTKPLRLIVGFAPGSVTDVFARVISVPLGEALGQSIVVDNRPGANGNLATELVARSAADGHTLLMSSGSAIAINPHVYATLKVDPLKDLEAIAPVARVSLFLVTRTTLPVNSVADFVALARAQPGRLKYGTPGNGTSPHIAAEMFARATGVSFTHVPYKGSAGAVNDLLGGQIDFWFDPGLGLPYVKAGRLRMLATASAKRTPLLPDVPALAEANLHAVDADTWFGVYGPVGLPRGVVQRLNAEIGRIVQTPQVIDRLTVTASEPAVMSSKDFAALQRSASQRFAGIVRAAGIKID